jgi:glycerophosphoryl diester phosphodiesterase
MVVLVCHRGASALAPENSLEAFQVAMDYGVDFSELDVHVNRDGDLVVTHDPSDAPHLPRLHEVFALVGQRMGIYVELKGDGTALAVADLLKGWSSVRVIVGSFRLELVEEFRRHAPQVATSILFSPGWDLTRILAACHELGVQYAHPCFRPLEADLVAGLHAAGLRVMAPHTNDPTEARAFVNVGIDVVASDDPRVLLPLRT